MTAKPPLNFAQPQLDDATIAAVTEVMRSNWIASGQHVLAFEKELSTSFGNRPTRVLTSATGALEVALQICGIGPGYEVITSAQSFFSTMNMIVKVGAKPVFVDCELESRAIDLAQVEAAITPATRAIMPTHFPGALGDMDALLALARKHGLRVIEDAAQAFGSSWGGKKIGAIGDMVSFSFHPNKNVTSIEGGALVLNNEEEAVLAQKYRLQGITRTGFDGMDCDVLGGKYNLTDVAARVGLGQLKHVARFTEQRRELARAYFEHFAGGAALRTGVELPVRNFTDSNWHMFQIALPLEHLTLTRSEFMAQMKERGIGTGVHYPALHLFTLYRARGFHEGMFPHAEKYGASTVTLPLFTQMSHDDVARVVHAVNEICAATTK